MTRSPLKLVKYTRAPLEKLLPQTGLAKAAPRPFTPAQEAQRVKMAAAYRDAFGKMKQSVVAQYLAAMAKLTPPADLRKAAEDDKVAGDAATGDPVAIASAMSLSDFDLVWDDTNGVLEAVAEDGTKIALAKVGTSNPELVNVDILSLVNNDAVAWAQAHAGELLGKDASGGELAASTRGMIARTISQGMLQKMTPEEIAALLIEDYAFSDDRALMIAETEVANASSHGQLIGYQGAGLKSKKWLLSRDEGVCLICQANADAGWVGIDNTFPGGVQAPLQHPNCRCVIVARLKPPEE